MAILSKKTVYALEALVCMGSFDGKNPVQLRDLSSLAKVPYKYLEVIFNQLKQAGIVRSVRGYKGGYFLAVPSQELLVLDIYEALEGPLLFFDEYSSSMSNLGLWQSKHHELSDVFRFSIHDILDYQQKMKGVVNYAI